QVNYAIGNFDDNEVDVPARCGTSNWVVTRRKPSSLCLGDRGFSFFSFSFLSENSGGIPMFRIKPVLSPSFTEAVVLVAIVVAIISSSIIWLEAPPHVPILLSILLLICCGLTKGVSYPELERGLVNGAGAGMSAVFLFFFIGILI